MFIRLLLSILLLTTSLTTQAIPIRAYFAGQIDSISMYEVPDTKSIPFRVGEKISGWIEMDWDKAYDPYEPSRETPSFYVGGVSYELFLGDGSRSVWTLEDYATIEVSTRILGNGLPEYFYDQVPRSTGLIPRAWVDDASFGFSETSGTFAFNNVTDLFGGVYDVYGSFLFTDHPVPVSEPSPLSTLSIALFALLMVRGVRRRVGENQ
jgi:hypothetical protein